MNVCVFPITPRSIHLYTALGTITFISCAAAALATLLYILWYTYLISTNQTMIEYYDNRQDTRKHNLPYYLSFTQNWCEVFGYEGNFFLRFFGVSIRPPPGNGLVFDLNPHYTKPGASAEESV
jgi:hypothetical protein